jgi:signal transduction histidine kinase
MLPLCCAPFATRACPARPVVQDAGRCPASQRAPAYNDLVRTADRSSPRAPFPWRRVLRLAAAGVVTAGAVAVVGTAWHVVRFGTTLASARDRVQADVRQSFDQMARHLRDMAHTTVPASDDVRMAVDADTIAARRLFERVGRVVAADPSPDVAITIYAPDQRPLAWAGRPSELLADRLREGESWFIAPGALGLRLVYVMPIGSEPSPLAVVVAERALTTDDTMRRPGMPPAGENTFVVPGRLVRVSIELPFEGARAVDAGGAFEVLTPTNERLLTAVVAPGDIELARDGLRQGTAAAAMTVIAITLLLLCGPLLDWRSALRSATDYAAVVIAMTLLIVSARVVMIVALTRLRSRPPILSESVYGSPWLTPALGSPLDLLLTVLSAAALVALVFFALEAWRLRPSGSGQARRPDPGLPAAITLDTAAGVIVGLLLVGYLAFLADTVSHVSVDLLRFSIAPWNSAAVAVHGALVLAHATAIGLGVLVFRAASAIWRRPRRSWLERARAAACWLLPAIVIAGLAPAWLPRMPLFVALGVTVALTLLGPRITARYRHGSQAFRLALFTLGLIVPAVAFYPALFTLARRAKAAEVESRYAEQARDQRQAVQTQLRQTLIQIDRFPGLADLIAAAPSPLAADTVTDRAFLVWQTTSLASYPMTSSVELYGPDGGLVSRFAFNLPDDLRATPPSQERACEWEVYAEVAAFFAEERRVLHAGRALCTDGDPTTARGSIVVHAMLDYENLPFIASRNPYVELLRPNGAADRREPGGDIEYAVYGWSRTPLYASRDRAWTLDDAVFARLESDRAPIWTTLYRGSDPYRVYLLNDRGGIYALGFPAVSPLGHAVNIAEVTVLGALVAALLLIGGAGFSWVTRRAVTAKSLLQEVRASFYRKLFLAFVAAVVVPVVLLAIVTRAFVAEQMRASVEREALRTAFAASRVVEDLVAPRAEQQGAAVDDNLMVWVSRLIDQDSNIFVGSRLVATSERNLFASGLLPTRTQADVYRALQLHREGATVVRERVGGFEYLVAAAPLTVGADDAVLTVPLTSRQRDIDAEVDALDRRVVLVALLFVIGGAGLGYSMAERIADPVSRLTRATRRIASGDLDARIAATSADEFRRLVDDFNRMADQLKRQRAELERTNRLEAWAEMARQVAHEIKNPLTPIQLNAEHLRRVHRDRGEPLGSILRDCVENILTQVTLLRRIASEFSTFASSPTAKPTIVDVAVLLRDIVEPYRTGLADRVRVDADLPPALPAIHVDRTLVSRAITNLLENALHAMPSGGVLSVSAWAAPDGVHIRIGDTGSGMDAEALARAFEPYFSTKASGTGLGLPIAKRNVELNGGRVQITSERDRGTTVELIFPSLVGAVAGGPE